MHFSRVSTILINYSFKISLPLLISSKSLSRSLSPSPSLCLLIDLANSYSYSYQDKTRPDQTIVTGSAAIASIFEIMKILLFARHSIQRSKHDNFDIFQFITWAETRWVESSSRQIMRARCKGMSRPTYRPTDRASAVFLHILFQDEKTRRSLYQFKASSNHFSKCVCLIIIIFNEERRGASYITTEGKKQANERRKVKQQNNNNYNKPIEN